MPYVPSLKTVPPAEDRKILDPLVDVLAEAVASKIEKNSDLKKEYKRVFIRVASDLDYLLRHDRAVGNDPEWNLAHAIYKLGEKYGYEGAHLGEHNYATTRFIQRVPQIKVARGDWKATDELRYWLYDDTIAALTYAARHTDHLDCGSDGTYEDVKDEYKWRVNRAYEMAQIRKSGDCYDTPWFMKQAAVVDEASGKVVGYVDVAVARSEETLNCDLLDGCFVWRKGYPPLVGGSFSL